MVSIIHSESTHQDTDQNRKSRLPKKIHRTKDLSKESPVLPPSETAIHDLDLTRSQSQTRSRSKIRNAITGVFSHFRSKSRTSLDSQESPVSGGDSPKYFSRLFTKKTVKSPTTNGEMVDGRRQVHWQRSVHNISCIDSDDSVIETPRNSISVLNLNHVTMERELNPTTNPLTTSNATSMDLMELDWKLANEMIPNSPMPSYIHASCARYGYTRARSPGVARAHLPPSRVEMKKQKFENGMNGVNGGMSPTSSPPSEKPMSPETPIKDIISKFDSMKMTSSVSPKPPIPPKPGRNGPEKKSGLETKALNGEESRKENGCHENQNIDKVVAIDVHITSIQINGNHVYDFSLPDYPLPDSKTIQDFRDHHAKVRSRLEDLSKTTELVIEDPKINLNEEISGVIRSAHGMTNLLLRKNMSKFSKLCDDAMNPEAEKKTYVEDLEGFWMLIDMELENLRIEYNKIDKWAKNGWKVEETKNEEAKKPTPPSVQNGSSIKSTKTNGVGPKTVNTENPKLEASKKRRQELAEFKRKAREKMESEAANKVID